MPDPPLDILRRTAQLARLELTDEELARLAPQFQAILEHFEVLSSLDLGGVEATLAATELEDVKRADDPAAGIERSALLRGAPDPRDGYLAVPKTIGAAPRTNAGGGS
jgi:aspartyl-tRNA(Asn)/glutamyl-tRNA(Gln) amidotransferase subunit C